MVIVKVIVTYITIAGRVCFWYNACRYRHFGRYVHRNAVTKCRYVSIFVNNIHPDIQTFCNYISVTALINIL